MHIVNKTVNNKVCEMTNKGNYLISDPLTEYIIKIADNCNMF